jgi:hypothetical protein
MGGSYGVKIIMNIKCGIEKELTAVFSALGLPTELAAVRILKQSPVTLVFEKCLYYKKSFPL